MAGSLASRRYAKSMLELALEKSALDAVYSDMGSIKDTIDESAELRNLLASPIVKSEKKEAILTQIFGGSVNPLTKDFLSLVASKGRERILKDIAVDFITAYKSHKNISLVEVTSAVQLNDDQKAKVLAMVAKQGLENAEVVEKVDPSLIGGFVLRMGDKQIDASVANKLNTLKQELIKN